MSTVRALGTDSGTRSYDIFGFDDETNEVIADESIPRDDMVRDPGAVARRLKEIARQRRVDAIVASSGYGIPLKLAKEASDEEIALATFISDEDAARGHRILGLRRLLKAIRDDPELREITYFTPGVVQLPTVPPYRKLNRVDMGTSDKVYSAALAIARHAEAFRVSYRDVNIIVVEVGFAYTSAMAVSSGQVVDGVAGTAGFPGYLGSGCVDGEVAYAISNVSRVTKEALFTGGAAYLQGSDPFRTPIEDFASSRGQGYRALVEFAAKDVLALLASVSPQAVYASGRFTRLSGFVEDLEGAVNAHLASLGARLRVLKLVPSGRVAKEAAEGAAIIANGLAGGRYRGLVDVMRLRESSGSIFDYVTIFDRDELRRAYSRLTGA